MIKPMMSETLKLELRMECEVLLAELHFSGFSHACCLDL